MTRLDEARGRFEVEWRELQRALKREGGAAPTGMSAWLRPLVGLTAGFAVGRALRRRVRRKGQQAP